MEALKFIGLAIACAVGGFFLWAYTRTPSAEEEARHGAILGIEHCWKQQARKSLEPDTARFIAGACEKMEADFKAKYGREP